MHVTRVMRRVALAPRRAMHSQRVCRSSVSEAGIPAGGRTTTATSERSPKPRKQRKGVMFALAGFVTCTFTFPFWLHFYNASAGNHYTASKALTPAQTMRGAYLNSGTRDIGPDPTWHAQHNITPVEGDTPRAK